MKATCVVLLSLLITACFGPGDPPPTVDAGPDCDPATFMLRVPPECQSPPLPDAAVDAPVTVPTPDVGPFPFPDADAGADGPSTTPSAASTEPPCRDLHGEGDDDDDDDDDDG